MQDHPARSVIFSYSQDNANQWPTYRLLLYAFGSKKWQFAWLMSFISGNQTTYQTYG